MNDPHSHDLRLALAELFFLDTEHDDVDYAGVAARLKHAGWDRARTHRELIELVAPAVSANLGHGVYPVIGEWAGFDKAWLRERIERRIALRARHPRWYFWLQDRHARWMLGQLGINRLLALID